MGIGYSNAHIFQICMEMQLMWNYVLSNIRPGNIFYREVKIYLEYVKIYYYENYCYYFLKEQYPIVFCVQ